MFAWMKQEADRQNLSESARGGGIILDEMAIQEDLSLVSKGVRSSFSGQATLTPFTEVLIERRKGTVSLSSHTKLYSTPTS